MWPIIENDPIIWLFSFINHTAMFFGIKRRKSSFNSSHQLKKSSLWSFRPQHFLMHSLYKVPHIDMQQYFYLYCNLFWRLKILFKFRCILSCLSQLPKASSDWSFWNIFATTFISHWQRTDTRNLHLCRGNLPWDFYILHLRCFQIG